MSSLLSPPFPSLIQLIPASQHSIEIDSSFWKKKFTDAGQALLWNAIFRKAPGIRLTRDRLLNYTYSNHNQKCVEILLWGYPNDTRGLVSNLLPARSLQMVVKNAQSSDPWPKYWNNFDLIGRIGISTITKLAYFYKRSFRGHQALILDSRLIEATSRWAEVNIPRLTYITACQYYEEYLNKMHNVATKMSCSPDQLELFLFALGDGF